MYVVFLCISAAVFFSGIAWAVKLKREDRIPWQSFLLILLQFTAFALWVAVLPFIEHGSVIYRILYAVYYVFEAGIGNANFYLFSDRLASISFWRVYTIFLLLVMPLTTFGTILFSFMNVFGWFRYTVFRGKRKIILFSRLTNKSRDYAGLIKDKDALLIYCNTEDGEKLHFNEGSSHRTVYSSQNEIQVLKQLDKRNLSIIEMGEDDEENLQNTVEIIRYLEDETQLTEENKRSISLYTYSCRQEAAAVLDNVMGRVTGKVQLPYRQTLINELKLTAFKLMYDARFGRLVSEDTKTLEIMIVGFEQAGQEILKAVSWTCCFPRTDTHVHVISPAAAEDGKRLLSECPELGVDLRHEDGFLEPEYGEQINEAAPVYYYSTETRGPLFDSIIRSLPRCGVIIISLSDDIAGLETALHIYRLHQQIRLLHDSDDPMPEIYVRMSDEEKLMLFPSEEDRKVFEYFRDFGSNKDIYGENAFGQSDIECLAERAHNLYREQNGLLADENTQYAYLPTSEKNANRAAAVPAVYKLDFLKQFDAVKIRDIQEQDELERINAGSRKAYELVPEEIREEIADWEHIRWQAYMRTEGFVHCAYEHTERVFLGFCAEDRKTAYEKTKARLREAGMHPAIGDPKGDNAEHLRKLSVLVDSRKDPNHFHKNDRLFVDSVPDIVRNIYRINSKPTPAGNDPEPIGKTAQTT